MDYRNIISRINNLEKDIFNFINTRTERNIVRGDDIVNNYVSALNLNEYSIKSFKAKIIHNELEHRRTSEDFQKLLKSCYTRIDAILDEYFKGYLEVLKNSKTSPNKVIDLREYEIAKRRQRQDIINRMNNLEKDYIQKNSQDTDAFNNKKEDHKQDLQLENRKLQIDINKIKETLIKDCGAEEKALLATDDKKRIKELKADIKAKRIVGLEKEFEQKKISYEEIKNKKIAFFDIEKEFELLFKKQKAEYENKVHEYKHQIKDLELQIKMNNFNYDCNDKIKQYEKLRNDKNILASLSKSHNDFLYKNEMNELNDEKNSKFLIAFTLTKLYQISVYLLENNLYDPLVLVVDDLIRIYKTCNELCGEHLKNINKELEQSLIDLKSGLEMISLDEKTEKRVSKEELRSNVLTSIDRYYSNISLEIKYFAGEVQKFIQYVTFGISQRYQNLVEGNQLFRFNECLFVSSNYSRLDLSKFGYSNYEFNTENTVTLDDYYNAINSKLDEYMTSIDVEYSKNIKNMEKSISVYDNKIKDEINKDEVSLNKFINNNLNIITKIENNYNLNKNKYIKFAEKEYKKNCRKALQYMKKKKKVL